MEWIKAHKTAVIVIAVVVVLAIIGAGSANNNNNGNGGNNQTQTSNNDTKKDNKYGMSADDISDKCQDEATIKLQGLGVLDKYLIYALEQPSDVHEVYTDLYDKDGHQILFVRWNGKDKSANKIVTFVCYGYVDGDSFKVKQLNLDNETISGTEFDRYNKDGVLQQ